MKRTIYFLIILLIVFTAFSSCIFNNTKPTATPSISPDKDKCNADFSLNGYYAATPPLTQYKNKNDLISKPLDPVRSGYTFGGWHTDAECTAPWDFEKDKLETHTLLYAKWTLNTYTLSFDLDGGTGTLPSPQELNYLDKAVKPQDSPTKEGFIFAGWWIKDSENKLSSEWNFSTDLPQCDVTLYAGWGTAGMNDDYSFVELDSAVKILGFINPTAPETVLSIPSEINGKPVLSLGEKSFEYLTGPENIILPFALTTINDRAFYNSPAVTNLTLPNSVTSIGKMAFHSCSDLYNLNIGKGVLNIGEMAFYQCTSLLDYSTATLTIPENVLIIEKEAFSIAGNAIYNLALNNGLVRIGESAFKYTKSLRVDIPDTVETIGAFAFQYNQYLTRIEIGKAIKSIGDMAFESCNNSLYVIINAEKPPVLGSIDVFGVFTYHNDVPNRPSFYITVPVDSEVAYESDEKFKVYYKTRITALKFSDIVYPSR